MCKLFSINLFLEFSLFLTIFRPSSLVLSREKRRLLLVSCISLETQSLYSEVERRNRNMEMEMVGSVSSSKEI